MRRTRCFGKLAIVAAALLGVLALSAAIDPPPESPIGGDPVSFESSDGVSLLGHLFRPSGQVKAAILFVHEPFRSQRDWAYLAEKMSRHGFVSLVFDLRGHGESLHKGEEVLDRELFAEEDYQAMALDVQAALAFLRAQKGIDPRQVHVAGSDLGGSLCLLQAVTDDGIRTVAMLSPGLGYDGVNLVGRTGGLGNRPLLMVYSVEDGYARKSVEVLDKEVKGPKHVETYYGVGHGTKMLGREPQLEVLMTGWFLGTVIGADGRRPEDAGKPITGEVDAQVGTADADAERQRLEAARREAEATRASSLEEDEDDGSRNRRWELEEEEDEKP